MARAGHSGLQQHSIGADYPFALVATHRHATAPLRWMVMDCSTRSMSQSFPTSQAARIHMNSIRIRNCMHS